MSMMHCSLLSLGCAFGFASPKDSSLTALRALKIGQRRLRPEVRSKLLCATSPRTDGSLVPDAWRFVFLDMATSEHSRIVTVAAKTSSEHPDTIEAFGGAKPEIVSASPLAVAQNKLLIDSDIALEHARSAAKLRGIRSAEYRLAQQKGNQEPLWTLMLFAEDEEPVARFQIGAKTGAVKILNGNN